MRPAFAIELDAMNVALLQECREDHPDMPLHQVAHMLFEHDGHLNLVPTR
jgi:hypothetical protein